MNCIPSLIDCWPWVNNHQTTHHDSYTCMYTRSGVGKGGGAAGHAPPPNIKVGGSVCFGAPILRLWAINETHFLSDVYGFCAHTNTDRLAPPQLSLAIIMLSTEMFYNHVIIILHLL